MTLGDLQNLTMLAVAHLEERSWANQIRLELKETAGREVSIGTVFVTLTRLEDHGLLTSQTGDAPDRGGRPRRIFTLTPAGWDALRATRAASERMWSRLEER